MAGISLTARPFNWIATIRKGPNAIHGFVRSLLWNIAEVTPSRVSLNVTINRDSYAARGYPFSLELQLSYSLDQLGLSCQFNIRNAGTARAPVGMGFHQYFTVGTVTIDEAEVRIPCLLSSTRLRRIAMRNFTKSLKYRYELQLFTTNGVGRVYETVDSLIEEG